MTSQEFDLLYRKNYPILYRLVFPMLRDEEECRDVINDVFTNLLNNPNQKITNIEGYLYRMAKNKALSIISRQNTLSRFQKLYPIEAELDNAYDKEREQMLLQVLQFLDKELSPIARETISLIFEKGLSYKEAAQKMNVTTSAINKHVVRTLKLLREHFNSK